MEESPPSCLPDEEEVIVAVPPVCGKKECITVTTCGLPSLGMTLVMSILMFGLDRFYVGQMGIGVALLIGCLSVIGFIVVAPIQLIAQISLVMSILTNKRTSFMYGCHVMFEPPTIVDKIIAICWLLIVIVGVVLGSLSRVLF